LHNIDKKKDLDIDINIDTTTNSRRANRSRDNLLFILTTLQEEIYKEITNKKIEKLTKDLNKV